MSSSLIGAENSFLPLFSPSDAISASAEASFNQFHNILFTGAAAANTLGSQSAHPLIRMSRDPDDRWAVESLDLFAQAVHGVGHHCLHWQFVEEVTNVCTDAGASGSRRKHLLCAPAVQSVGHER